MTDFANLIEVSGAPGAYTITIDGTELPWYVQDGVTTTAQRGEATALTISIPSGPLLQHPEVGRTKSLKFGARWKSRRAPKFAELAAPNFTSQPT